MPAVADSLAATPAKPLPLYLRLGELITREISAGHYRQGERLPTETELAQHLNVAVGTLRKALALLEARGLLERRQGSGTYVRQQTGQGKTGRSIYEFFRLELQRGGGLPTALVLDFQRMKKPARVPALGDGSSKQYYRVRRLRYLSDTPVALEEIWFDARHRDTLAREDLGEALYHFYQEELGFWISHVEDQVGVGTVPAWAPALFTQPAHSSCGQIERWSWAGNNSLEEYSVTWFNPELAHYTARWA